MRNPRSYAAEQQAKYRRTEATPALFGGIWTTEFGQNVFTDGRGWKFYFADTTSGAVSISLPAAADVAPDILFVVKRLTAGANGITVTPLSGTIDGAASHSIATQYMSYAYASDGTNYYIVWDGVVGGAGSVAYQDEGVALGSNPTTINFVGTGISASLTGGVLTVTSAAGSGSGEGSVSISSMITTRLASYITSTSVATALATYVTSASLITALGTYITSASVATALAPYITSASITTVLGGYITSGSLATALTPYITSASITTVLGTYVTSSSLATALSPYITSNSASIALATKQATIAYQDEGVALGSGATTINFVGTGISASLTGAVLTVTAVAGAGSGEGSVSVSTMISTALGPYMTSNSISLAVATDTLTVRGAGAVSATLSAGALTLAGRPVGSVLLSYQTITAGNSFAFSGSWSDFAVLQAYAIFRTGSGTSVTTSAAIYTDGGTTAILGLATASNTLSTGQAVALNIRVMGGNGLGLKTLDVEAAKATNLVTRAVTATANTGFVNALKFFVSATVSTGMAVLYGWRSS